MLVVAYAVGLAVIVALIGFLLFALGAASIMIGEGIGVLLQYVGLSKAHLSPEHLSAYGGGILALIGGWIVYYLEHGMQS
ncbi:hypothetical protein [Longibacter salinarum]|uniref:hypothetical protein n=1 Tax=Longibacter salinarum TaxID=1850348 RepID=UPI00117EA080|nr:hypothetical protein [Longibacter salinarum]